MLCERSRACEFNVLVECLWFYILKLCSSSSSSSSNTYLLFTDRVDILAKLSVHRLIVVGSCLGTGSNPRMGFKDPVGFV